MEHLIEKIAKTHRTTNTATNMGKPTHKEMNDATVVGTEISTGWMTRTAEIFSRTGRKNRIPHGSMNRGGKDEK